jgi:hypothetical protein
LRIGIPIIFSILDVPVIAKEPLTKSLLSPVWLFLFATIIAPFFEEFTFRYPLNYKKNSLFIGFLAFIIIAFFTNQQSASELLYESKIMHPQLLWWHIAFALLIFVATRFDKINKFLSQIWNKYLIVIVYVLSTYFAYMHFLLPLSGINWIWLPVSVVPQFFSALYFSYLRLRVKFSYCIFLHMIFNGIAFAPVFF